MRLLVNDKEVIIPSSLSEITLGQRIEFHNQHGRLLDEMLDSIQQMKDEYFRELELAQWHHEKMYRTFAFFAKVPVEVLKESTFIDEIATIYYSCLKVLVEEEDQMDLQREFAWNNEQWVLAEPTLKQGDRIKFGELIDSKQIIQDLIQLGRGKWECMLRLCAIYLRKKGEEYKEEFVYEDSERMKMMEQLPMNIAMQVGFFLQSFLNIWINTLKSSVSPGLKEQAATRSSISKHTAGSTS